MNIVFVKLDLCDGKEYCFEVPDCMRDMIFGGTRVLCNTARGQQTGVVTVPIMSGAGAEEMAVRNGATFPLQQVVGVVATMDVNQIQLPEHLRRSVPAVEKLQRRMFEYARDGYFHTNVEVDSNGVLLDGYTAYLVCKMWDVENIQVNVRVVQACS